MSPTRVLVAHDSEPIRAVIEALLVADGYAVQTAADSEACLRGLEDEPAALVLDVALSGMHAFQIIEEARRRPSTLRVVLVASIYNRTSYKRRPTSLYGADDYVEQHHLTDLLLQKLRALLGGPAPEQRTDARESNGSAVRQAALAQLDLPAAGDDPEAVLRAERLARLIVSDIALYNGDAIAIASGRDALEAHLRQDLEEGRLLFELRVPREVRVGRDFIGEALAELVAQRGRVS